jgi:hypothetical protein
MMEPEEFEESARDTASSGSRRRRPCLEPDFDSAPSWVKTFYWTPLLGWLARRWIESHEAYRRAEPPPPGDWWDDSGVHEPRRPKPFAGAGAVEMEEPFEDDDGGGLDGSYALVGRDEPGAPTTAA